MTGNDLPALTTYEVTVRSSDTGDVLALLDTVNLTALRYERKLNDVGVFQLTVAWEEPGAEHLAQKDALITITRFAMLKGAWHEYDEGTYIVRFVQLFIDDNEQAWVIVAGFSLEYLLLQRVVIPSNDPLVAGGYSTKGGAADEVMAELVTQQAGAGAGAAERVDTLTVASPAGTGETVGGRWAWDSLLEAVQGLTEQGRMDFRIVRTSGVALEFRAEVVGEDKTRTANYPGSPFVLFTPEFGNMRSPSLTRDWKEECTQIFLKGQGAGDYADIYERQSSHIADTAFSYAAVVADARKVEDGDATQYLTQAVNELAKHRAKVSFTFELLNTALEYRTEWDVGDLVTACWDEYEQDMRLTGVSVELTGSEERIEPELTEV